MLCLRGALSPGAAIRHREKRMSDHRTKCPICTHPVTYLDAHLWRVHKQGTDPFEEPEQLRQCILEILNGDPEGTDLHGFPEPVSCIHVAHIVYEAVYASDRTEDAERVWTEIVSLDERSLVEASWIGAKGDFIWGRFRRYSPSSHWEEVKSRQVPTADRGVRWVLRRFTLDELSRWLSLTRRWQDTLSTHPPEMKVAGPHSQTCAEWLAECDNFIAELEARIEAAE